MPTRYAQASWTGSLKEGRGRMSSGTGVFESPYTAGSRFEGDLASNPEELLGAAHAGCFAMALSHELGQAGHDPVEIRTTAAVELTKNDDGYAIPKITLNVQAKVDGEIEEDRFKEIVESAKSGCPVSKALAGVDIELGDIDLRD